MHFARIQKAREERLCAQTFSCLGMERGKGRLWKLTILPLALPPRPWHVARTQHLLLRGWRAALGPSSSLRLGKDQIGRSGKRRDSWPVKTSAVPARHDAHHSPPSRATSLHTEVNSLEPGHLTYQREGSDCVHPPKLKGRTEQKDWSKRQGEVFKDRHHFTMVRTKSSFKNDRFLEEGIFLRGKFPLGDADFREHFGPWM